MSPENDVVKRAVNILRRKPNATDEEICEALGLRSRIVARIYKIKALELLHRL